MLALIGYTRFPIFYSSNGRKILGSDCKDSVFKNYAFGIRDKESIAIRTLTALSMKRRFVVEGRAINPSLKFAEYVVKKIYVYPSYEPEETITNAYAMGITLKGTRRPVFVPLVALKPLTEEEAAALLGVSKVKDFNIDRLLSFLRSLNIQVEHRNLVDTIVVDIYDPVIDERYQVLINDKGKVLDTNVCIETDVQMYLPELVLLIRDRGDVFVYSRRW
jgi:hypothetical protein